MGTLEMFIVLMALVALICLVAVAIDWVGRPLRHRAFIPRMYRYSDELQTLPPEAALAAAPVAAHPTMVAPPTVPPLIVPSFTTAPPSTERADTGDSRAGAATQAQSAQFPPQAPFVESVTQAQAEFAESRSLIATSATLDGPQQWHPGLALDTRVGGAAPTVEVKAERFWRATAARLGADSHFDEPTRNAMAQGKPPRRKNPRSGADESMELIGLRSASALGDVRMHWPEDAVDPWSST